MRITSSTFEEGGWIPERHTCDGRDVSPPLEFEDVPQKCASLALIVDDPDAPRGVFTHWLVWNMPAEQRSVPEGAVPPGAMEGTNDFGVVGWSGPCPPEGRHRYRFRLIALDRVLDIRQGSNTAAVAGELERGVLATAAMSASYARTRS